MKGKLGNVGPLRRYRVYRGYIGTMEKKMETTIGVYCLVYSPPLVDRIWLWVYYNKIPIYPIFYLLEGIIGSELRFGCRV